MALIAAVAIVGAACSKKTNGGNENGKTTVKLAFFGALTGAAAGLVVPGFQGAQLAVNQANQGKFGDLPVTIQLVREDTQGSGTQAPPLATKVANDQSFVGVIGPAFSGESQAAGPILDGASVPFVTASATGVSLAANAWKHWFRANANDNTQGPSGAEYVARIQKPSCAYVTSDDTTYGKGLAQVVESTLKSDGVTIQTQLGAVANGGTGETKDFSALVTKIKASGCPVVFYGGYSSEAPGLRNQMTDAGLSDVTLVGGDGIKDDTYLKVAGANGDGTIATCPCVDITTNKSADATSFIKDYQALWVTAPGIYSAEYYDVARMYIEAFKAGDKTRDDITNYFDSVNYQGLTKNYKFGSNHELAATDVRIFIWKVDNSTWVNTGQDKDVIPSCAHCSAG
ncbi:MAG: branched-chain amino acid ABC transporter substrate-binding protein [Actinomycetota bacterium]